MDPEHLAKRARLDAPPMDANAIAAAQAAIQQVAAAPNIGGAAPSEHMAAAEGMMQMPAQPSTSTAAPAAAEPATSASTAGGATFNDVITHTAKDGRTYFSATLPGMSSTANQGITIARHIVAPLAISQPAGSAPAGEPPKAAEAELPMAEASVATFEGQAVAAPMAFVSAPHLPTPLSDLRVPAAVRPSRHTDSPTSRSPPSPLAARAPPLLLCPQRPAARLSLGLRCSSARSRTSAPQASWSFALPRHASAVPLDGTSLQRPARLCTSPQTQSLGLGATTASQATSSAAGADASSTLGYHPSLAGQINWGTPDDPNAAFAHHFGHVFPGMQHAYRLPQQSAAAQALAVLSGPTGSISAPKPKVMKPMRPKEPKEIKEPKPVKQRPPKAPKSAYLCFEQERRRLLLEARPEKVDDIVKQHGDISRAVGRQCAPRRAQPHPARHGARHVPRRSAPRPARPPSCARGASWPPSRRGTGGRRSQPRRRRSGRMRRRSTSSATSTSASRWASSRSCTRTSPVRCALRGPIGCSTARRKTSSTRR